VTETPHLDATYDVECPHCHKHFQAEAMSGSAARYAGFKCPHCKLFVPWARVDEQGVVDKID
jgi:endogenous inhibitor of DNA gyrase (YacG/DUF329 family)